jgi:pimeloyl-ACP methyl ester carboxylesterase
MEIPQYRPGETGSRTVTVGDSLLAIRTIGNVSAGPVLVFLHEGLGTIRGWRDVPDHLAAATGRPALVYERTGYGNSGPVTLPRPLDYLEREAEDMLPRLLDHLGIERGLPIGHSDGGSIALLFAAAFPERCVAAVTEAAHVFVEEISLDGIRAAVAAYETGDLKARLARQHGENTDGAFRGWSDTWLSPGFRDWSIAGRLPAIRCPVLVLQGAGDEYGTAAQVEAIVRGVSGPAEPHLIPGCGHAPHHQAREITLGLIAEFVARVG